MVKLKLYRFKRERNHIYNGVDVGLHPKVEVTVVKKFPAVRLTPILFKGVHPIPKVAKYFRD